MSSWPALHLPTLIWVCSAVLVLSAVVMLLFGLSRRVYAGYGWWLAAQCLLALGLVLQTQRDAFPAVLPVANLALLQWPVVILSGMRRFFARDRLRVPAAADFILLGLAYVAWLACWAATGDVTARVAAFSGGALVLNLYGAVMLSQLGGFRSSPALKLMVGAELFGGAVQAWRLAQAVWGTGDTAGRPEVLLAGGLVVAVSALAMVHAATLLTFERNEENLRAANRKLRVLADIDMLTRVSNRRHFQRLATRALQVAVPGTAAAMMFDIDHFKRLNDLLGHASGDEALRQVARCMRDTLRAQDVAGRLGGDEFAVLLPGTSVDAAMSVAARIVAQLEDRQVAPRIAPVSLSFGVVQARAGETLAEALRRADQALYEAKRQGRSRAVAASGREERPVFGESRPLGLTTR